MSKVVLKISGEALKSDDQNVSLEKLDIVYMTIKMLQEKKHKIAIVIGGGNFFRGREHTDMNKVNADTIGMLGTVMNALYIKDYLEKKGLKSVITTPFTFPGLIPNYSDDVLNNLFDNDNIVIFGGGVGKSGYSTDSGAYLAASKLDSKLIIKLTNVDGVYDSDPKINDNAKKYDYISYNDILENNIKVMDTYTIKKCEEDNIKILVMDFNQNELINDYFNNKKIGTLIGE